jgi:hypothetical protein
MFGLASQYSVGLTLKILSKEPCNENQANLGCTSDIFLRVSAFTFAGRDADSRFRDRDAGRAAGSQREYGDLRIEERQTQLLFDR